MFGVLAKIVAALEWSSDAGGPDVVEWWATFDPHTAVMNIDGTLYTVTVHEHTGKYPIESPAENSESSKPHPFGWSAT